MAEQQKTPAQQVMEWTATVRQNILALDRAELDQAITEAQGSERAIYATLANELITAGTMLQALTQVVDLIRERARILDLVAGTATTGGVQ